MTRKHANREQGQFAEQWVADRDDLEHAPDETDWYDCVNPRTGTKHEVKSTRLEYGGEYTGGDPGEFRLWEDQHISLLASDRAGTAWYDFVLLEDGTPIAHRRMSPTTLTRIIHDYGDWNLAGHSERPGKQLKIPHPRIIRSEDRL